MSLSKIVSEYDQEIPQSQTADNPVAPRGRAAQPSRDTRKTNQAKQPAVSFTGLEVIKLEFSLKLKIKRNDWLLADKCPQANNHYALF